MGGVGEPTGELFGEVVDGVGDELLAMGGFEVVADEFAEFGGGGSVGAVGVSGGAFPGFEGGDAVVGVDPGDDGGADLVGYGLGGAGRAGVCVLVLLSLVRARVTLAPFLSFPFLSFRLPYGVDWSATGRRLVGELLAVGCGVAVVGFFDFLVVPACYVPVFFAIVLVFSD